MPHRGLNICVATFQYSALLLAMIGIVGCAAPKPPPPPPPPAPQNPFTERLKPFIPASRPADPVTEAFPKVPRDAQPAVPLRYAVELWEILLPRDSVTTDETFWKRVEEAATPDRENLQRNGIRVGELPASDLETVRKLIEDRGGKHTTINGFAGRQVEVPIHDGVAEQTVFYYDRDGQLVGRSWENCDDLIYFSFETTPRNPNLLRLAFTPTVRGRMKKPQYLLVPGRPDREYRETVEESQYDATINADLSLDRLLVIAPSTEARLKTTLGGIFLTESTPSEKRERLILVIPHAYTRSE